MFATDPARPRHQHAPLPVTKHHHGPTRHRHRHVLAYSNREPAQTRRTDPHRSAPIRTDPHRSEIMVAVPTPPESTKRSLRYRLITRARDRWPQLNDLTVRHRGQFAYIDAELTDGTIQPLCRLRYGGSASSWGFAIYLASRNGYQDAVLPTGHPVGTPEEALDCACGLYLKDPTAWTAPPTN
jgi:hypothetical protein